MWLNSCRRSSRSPSPKLWHNAIWLENATPTSGADALFKIKSTLLLSLLGSVNWTIQASGNGLVFAWPGDVITAVADLARAGAWFVARSLPWQDAGQTYYTELCVQTDGGTGLRIKVAFRTAFTGGTPSPTQTPSAADEQYWIGGGTDASPTYTNFFAASGYRLQGFVSGFNETLCFLEYPIGGGPCSSLLYIDRPLPNPVGGGGNLLDKERICFYALTGSNCALALGLASDNTGPRSMFLYGTSGQLWGRCPPQVQAKYNSSNALTKTLPGGCATSVIYPEPVVPEGPFIYRRSADVAGVALPGEVGNYNTCDDKGQSAAFRFGGQTKSGPVLLAAVNPFTGDAVPNGALQIGDFIMPWSGTAIDV